MRKKTDLLSIGDVAERTGLSVSAIRYYESQKLVTPHRNAGGQRRFMRSDIRRLSFVMVAQQFGFSIEDIRGLLARLPDGRTPNKADWSKISRQIRADLDHKILMLTKLKANLDGCIGCGCLSLEKCQLLNDDDKARRHGAGPRFVMGDTPDAEDLARDVQRRAIKS